MDIIEILKKVEEIRKLASVVPEEKKNRAASEQLQAKKPRKNQKKPLTEEQFKQHIADRESKNLQAARTKYQELEADIRAYFEQEKRLEKPEDLNDILVNLKKTAFTYGCQNVTNVVSLDTPQYPMLPEQAPYYNHELYQRVLPICRLAYAMEKNGNPEEHAFKLAMIFKNPDDAIEYLQTYEIFNPKTMYKLHDACGFDLPEVDHCNFKLWQDLANQQSQHKKPNMFSPAFRALLKQAEAIESTYRQPRNSSTERSVEAVKLYVKEYVSLAQKFKKLMLTKIKQPTDEQKLALKEQKSALSQEITKTLFKILEACPSTSLFQEFIKAYDNEAQLAILEAFHEHYRLQSSGAHKILTDNGIQPGSIKRYYDLKPQNDDLAIPNLLIDGKTLGYPGYYLKKMDVNDDTERAMVASLGKFPKILCCQYLGGQGSQCAEHIITSPNGGAYVLFKGDPQSPSDKDEVTGMTWAWRGDNEGICFDSIESHHDDIDMVTDFYRYLALELCTNDTIPGCPVPYVNCGAQGGISSMTGATNYPAKKIFYKDYKGYSDSISQLKLADPDTPFLFFEVVQSEQLKEIINNKTQTWLTKHLNDASPYKNNDALKKTIAFALYTKNDNLLQLTRSLAGNRLQELNDLIETNEKYLVQLSAGTIDFNVIENGAYLNAINTSGQTALHIATLNADVENTRKLIALGINVNAQDSLGNTPLLRTLEHVVYKQKKEQGKTIAAMLMDAGADVNNKDIVEQTPLIIAAKNNDLSMVKELVKKGADIELFDDRLKTAIYWAAEMGHEAIFDYLNQLHAKVNLSSYISNESLFAKAVQSKNWNIINTLLAHKDIAFSSNNKPDAASIQYAMFDLNLLKMLLLYYPQNERLELIRQAFSALYLVGSQPVYVPDDLVPFITARMSEEEIKGGRKSGNFTGFSMASIHAMLLISILENNPPEKLWELMKCTDFEGNSVFVYFVRHFPVMEYIYNRLGEEEKEQFWELTNTESSTVLKTALSHGNLDNLKFLLEKAPHAKLVNAANGSIFNFDPQNLAGLQMVIPYLNSQELFAILSQSNDGKSSAFQLLIRNFQGLDTTELDKVMSLLAKKINQEDFIKLLITRTAASDLSALFERTALQMLVSFGNNSLLTVTEHLSPEALGKLFVDNDEGRRTLKDMLSNESSFESIKAIFIKLPMPREEKLLFLLDCIEDSMFLHYAHPSWLSKAQFFIELFPDEADQFRILCTHKDGIYLSQVLSNKFPNEFCALFSKMSPELQLKMVQHKQFNKKINGLTFLNGVQDQKVIKLVLESFQPAQRLSILLQEHDAGVSVIEDLCRNNKLFTAAMDTLSQDQIDHLMANEEFAAKLLVASARNKDSFAKVMTLIPIPISDQMLQRALDKGMLLNATVHEGELDAVLKIIPEEEHENRIKLADNHHDMIRNCIANYKIEALEKILNSYTEAEIYNIYRNDIYVDIPIYMHVECAITFFKAKNEMKDYEKIRDQFLNRLTPEHRHELKFLPIDRKGNTLLHQNASNPEQLRKLVQEIPANELLERIKIKNNEGRSALSEAHQNHRSLGVVLEALPEKEKLMFLQTNLFTGEKINRDDSSGSVVDYVTAFPYEYKGDPSFISEYLSVYRSIRRYLNKQPTNTLFKDKLPEEMFHILFTSAHFDEVKTKLFEIIENNPEHLMIKTLMRNKGDLEQLRVKWGMDASPGKTVNEM